MSLPNAVLPLPVSSDDLLFFTKHLGILVTSGVPIREALSILAEQSKNPSLVKVIKSIQNEVNNGHSLTESLAKHPRTFNSFYRSIVSIGEESGNLDKNLVYLSTELEKSIEFKRKLQGILLYPSIVVFIALMVAGGMSIFVLPQLASLFSSLNITLPFSTRLLIWISNFAKSYGVFVFAAILTIMGIMVLAYRTKAARKIIDPVLIRLPIVGKIIQNIEVATMCRNLGLMLKSGMPISRAFLVAKDSTDNTVYQGYLESIHRAIQGGKSIENELKLSRYRFIPATITRMLGVGERSGTLDESFIYLGDFYAEEVNDLTKKLPTILEPILLVCIAGVVLFVALAIITPIYEFTGSIRR